jgi:hypothetical protein
MFPETLPFNDSRIEIVSEEQTSEDRTVPDIGVNVIRDYEYAVYCKLGDRHEFAHASVPIIIIYPR